MFKGDKMALVVHNYFCCGKSMCWIYEKSCAARFAITKMNLVE